ncbi:unnamed protein product, partial [Brachionus calyciflorus]
IFKTMSFSYITLILVKLLGLSLSLKNGTEESLGLCNSGLYCTGELLHTIQMSRIFEDSKTFVDMPSKYSQSEILEKFDKLETKNLTYLKNFLNENFYSNGFEVVNSEPLDWVTRPNYISKIKDKNLQDFSLNLHLKWKNLLRKFDWSKICSNCESSALRINDSFIVPGGRFNEYYYWDTYWIIEGLLRSDMAQTAKGIIDNFLDILETNGFIPNGARVYYLNRSQPPLLIQMVYSYLKYTNDIQYLRNSIHLLDKEYEFWMREKVIHVFKHGQNYTLNHYRVKSDKPRPESYREDFINGQESGNSSKYYSNVMTAAESGWDFSSRWFENPMDIKTIQIDKIIPVDLNSIMFRNEKILSEFHEILGNIEKANNYKKLSELRHEAINKVLWGPKENTYGDYNYEIDQIHLNNLYITDLSPLWFGIKAPVNEDLVLNRYNSILYDYISGVPTSNINTHQQWDFPNVWAPYHHWLVDYLKRSNRSEKGLDIAQRFVNSVYCGWKKSGNIYEKYNALNQGGYGQGGEYVVQEGFGWTNGVVIIFMDEFYDDLKVECQIDKENEASTLRSEIFRVFMLNIGYLILSYLF